MNAIETMRANVVVGERSSSAIGSVRVVDASYYQIEVMWLAGSRIGRTEIVDLSSLINTHKFYTPLRSNIALFNTIRVIDDGFAVAWGDGSIDMSADSIERLAQEAMTGIDFAQFLVRHELTHQGAAAALGRSKRQIENYLQYETLPRMVVLACIGYEARRSGTAPAIVGAVVTGFGHSGVSGTIEPLMSGCRISYSTTAADQHLFNWRVPAPVIAQIQRKTAAD